MVRLKKNPNVRLAIPMILIMAGYILFLTSRLWMPPTSDARRLTPLMEAVSGGGRNLTLTRWTYSEKQNLMEAEILIDNPNPDGVNEYGYDAVDSMGHRCNVEAVVAEPDYVVLQIKDVSRRWSEISLRIYVPPSQIKHDGVENDGTVIKLYTNVRDVDREEEIKTLSEKEYKLRRLDDEIKWAEYRKQQLYLLIASEKNNQQILEDEKERLAETMKFQTEAEAAETQSKIESAESQTEYSKSLIKKYVEEIAALKERADWAEERKGLESPQSQGE
jgi:hypothetical protein